MKVIDTLKSTLLHGCTANGTSLTPRRWSITFLIGMGLKYSCKSILNKSNRCALAPLLNNILRSIFFFFYTALPWESLSAPLQCVGPGRAPFAVQQSGPRSCSSAAGLRCLRLQLGNATASPQPKEPNCTAEFLVLHLTGLRFSTPLTDPTF